MCEYAGGKPVCAMKVKVCVLVTRAEVGGLRFLWRGPHYPPIMIL